MNWVPIEQAISVAENISFTIAKSRTIGGGSINSAFLLESSTRQYFVKTNSAKYAEMFAAEAEGLAELHKPGVIKVPRPVCWDTQDKITFIVLEYIDFGRGVTQSAEKFGQQLAALHKVTAPCFGWHRDNTIGSTEQRNAQTKNWVEFYREQRLEFQIKLALSQGYNGEIKTLGAKLCDRLDAFFIDYQPQSSLLHGDLWSGNYDYDSDGNPVIFDPAVYYGDREADMAMTELFGGFPKSFYDAYQDAYPLDTGYEIRKTLYNLYHILNHLNLFGGGYYQQSVVMMQRLLSEL